MIENCKNEVIDLAPKNIAPKDIIAKLHDIYNDYKDEFCLPNIVIKLSTRMKLTNGFFTGKNLQFKKNLVFENNRWKPEYEHIGGYGVITMSLNLLKDSGWERFEQTFRHEMAHAAEMVSYHNCGHGENFVYYCLAFGGSLDRKNLKKKRHISMYEKCIPVDEGRNFNKYYKYEYCCPQCGNLLKYMKRISKKVRLNNVCAKCRTPVRKFTEIELVKT